MFECTACGADVVLGKPCEKCGGFLAQGKGASGPMFSMMDAVFSKEAELTEEASMSESNELMTSIVSLLNQTAPEKVTRLERVVCAMLRNPSISLTVWTSSEIVEYAFKLSADVDRAEAMGLKYFSTEKSRSDTALKTAIDIVRFRCEGNEDAESACETLIKALGV